MSEKKSETQRDMIYQMWYMLKGNGRSLSEVITEIEKKQDHIEKKIDEFLVHRYDSCPLKRNTAEKLGAWGTRVVIFGTIITVILTLTGII